MALSITTINSGSEVHEAGTNLNITGTDLDTVVKLEIYIGSNIDTYEQFNTQSSTLITINSYLPFSTPYGTATARVTDSLSNTATKTFTLDPPSGSAVHIAGTGVNTSYTDSGNLYSEADISTSGIPAIGWQSEYETTTQNAYTVESVSTDGFPTISGGSGNDAILGIRYHNGATWSGYTSLPFYDEWVGTAAGNLSAFIGSAVGEVEILGAGAGSFAAILGSASGVATGPIYNGNAVGVLKAITGAASGQVDNPVTGTASGYFYALTAAASGVAGPPITGTAAAQLYPMTAAAIGNVVNNITGTAAGTLTAMVGYAVADHFYAASGSAAGDLSPFTGSAAGLYVEPVTGTASGAMAAFSASAVGAVEVEAQVSGLLTAFTASALASFVFDDLDKNGWLINNPKNPTGIWTVKN